MGRAKFCFISSFLVWSCCVCLLLQPARSDDTTSQLLEGINKYRASLNLSLLTDNKNADCLAEQLAKQFKGQECSNTTGADTVPGTEESFPNFPDYLNSCNLNVTVTTDGSIMPACVPGLESGLLLSNYTKSQYSQFLNESSFVGVGMADEGNWVVVILTTNTPSGNYETVATSSSSLVEVGLHDSFLVAMLGLFMILFI